MDELSSNSITLIVTSPPYFNIKDYAKDGYQKRIKTEPIAGQIGDIEDYEEYQDTLLEVWKECERVLEPNGKLCINVPLMPIPKSQLNSHYLRDIVDIHAGIENRIIEHTQLYLMDVWIWNRTNPTKRLMFGSYPYPPNFYAQNTIEFITAYVKDGPPRERSSETKQASKLSEQEWVDYTKLGDLSFENKRKALEVLGVRAWLDVGNVTIEGSIPVSYGSIESTTSLRQVKGKSLLISGLYLARF